MSSGLGRRAVGAGERLLIGSSALLLSLSSASHQYRLNKQDCEELPTVDAVIMALLE